MLSVRIRLSAGAVDLLARLQKGPVALGYRAVRSSEEVKSLIKNGLAVYDKKECRLYGLSMWQTISGD